MNESELKEKMKAIAGEFSDIIMVCKKCGQEMKYKDVGKHSQENKHYEFKSKASGANIGLLLA